jgi:hypothetical protein
MRCGPNVPNVCLRCCHARKCGGCSQRCRGGAGTPDDRPALWRGATRRAQPVRSAVSRGAPQGSADGGRIPRRRACGAHGFGASRKYIFRRASAYRVHTYTTGGEKKPGHLPGENSVSVYITWVAVRWRRSLRSAGKPEVPAKERRGIRGFFADAFCSCIRRTQRPSGTRDERSFQKGLAQGER